MELIGNWIITINQMVNCTIETLKFYSDNTLPCLWITIVVLALLIFAVWVILFKKGRYFYGHWLGHEMLIRIMLSTVLCSVLLTIPFFVLTVSKVYLKDGVLVAGFIQGIGTIITGVGVVAAYVLKSDENNRQNTLKYTTESRSKWIDDGRQLTSELSYAVSEYLSYFSTINKGFSLKEFLDTFDRLNKIIPALYMRFNFNGARDRILLVILNRMLNSVRDIKDEVDKNGEYGLRKVIGKKEELQNLVTIFVLHLQIYYKVEWERLKREVKYVGNVNARDYYIKEKMVNLRNTYYKNQITREQAIFKDGIPLEVIDISVFSVYLRLMGAELVSANELDIVPAKLIELEQKEKIQNLASVPILTDIYIGLKKWVLKCPGLAAVFGDNNKYSKLKKKLLNRPYDKKSRISLGNQIFEDNANGSELRMKLISEFKHNYLEGKENLLKDEEKTLLNEKKVLKVLSDKYMKGEAPFNEM